eukprot:Gb_03387 [translate_table: standard]
MFPNVFNSTQQNLPQVASKRPYGPRLSSLTVISPIAAISPGMARSTLVFFRSLNTSKDCSPHTALAFLIVLGDCNSERYLQYSLPDSTIGYSPCDSHPRSNDHRTVCNVTPLHLFNRKDVSTASHLTTDLKAFTAFQTVD